jgi:hypothetical protein
MADTWYKITRRDWTIQDQFLLLWLAKRGPKDAALFGSHDLTTKTNYFYLSPGAARIAGDLISHYDGIPCPRPNLSGLALLVGDQSAIEGSC